LIQSLLNLFKKDRDTELRYEPPVCPEGERDFSSAEAIFEMFTRITGMHFHKKEAITKEKIKNFCLRNQICSFRQLEEKLEHDGELLQRLIDHLTVNETYFFREQEQLDILQRFVRESGKKVKILCAPCSSGEEVYSIIIGLLEAGIPEDRFEIIGIDINAGAIERAKRGIYSERSVNRADAMIKETYFRPENGAYVVNPDVKSLARFEKANIFDKNFNALGRFDYIFSRNLFIYFNETDKARAVRIFCDMLNDGGTIFFGHADIFDEPACLSASIIGKSRVYTKIS